MTLITLSTLAFLTAVFIYRILAKKTLAPVFTFSLVLLFALGTSMCSSPNESADDQIEQVSSDSSSDDSETKSCSKDSTKKCCKSDSTKKCCKSDSAKKCCNSKCDLSECSKMTKDECAKMCDEKGCTPRVAWFFFSFILYLSITTFICFSQTIYPSEYQWNKKTYN